MSYFFLEIGCEEIPAGFVNPAVEFLTSECTRQLNAANIAYTSVTGDGTPRRLFVYVEGIADKQSDVEEEIVGPPARIAFTEDGSLTDVAVKFAQSKGLDMSTVRRHSTDKGDYLVGTKKTIGISTREILLNMVPALVRAIPFRKSMRWGDGEFRFARPAVWFVSLLNDEVLPFSIDRIDAGRTSRGHRFHAPAEFTVDSYADWSKKVRDAMVIPSFAERREMIRTQIAELSKANNFVVEVDEDLLDTVANLVEYPFAVHGTFEEKYLTLPQDVLVTSMKNHQKYFYVTKQDGTLLNSFVGVSNTRPTEAGLIRQGYERVLRARLNDAMFFWKNDQTVPLEERAEGLKKVVYQEKLGTSWEKMERFSAVAGYLADLIAPDTNATTQQAAALCKADLMSEMVYEFPELQGIMGARYASLQGKPDVVSKAIFEHYLPRFAGDVLPETTEGALVSLGDKLDTISGCFVIDMIPTGNVDPYGLRRNAIGILQIIRAKGYRIDLKQAVAAAVSHFEGKQQFNKEETVNKVYDFIIQRLKQIVVNDGAAADAFDAACPVATDSILIERLAKVLTGAKGSEQFATIAQSYKRINNILKKNGWESSSYSAELFQTDEERLLGEAIQSKGAMIADAAGMGDFDTALSQLLTLAAPVNAFFESVMVMAEDEKIRNNRLGLLVTLKALFNRMGDLSVLQ